MKTQTLFIVASAIIGALAAPVQRREAQPDVITVYENVVHIVTTTSTVWVPPSKPTPAPAPEKKVEEVQEEPEVVEEPEEEPEEVEAPAPEPEKEEEQVEASTGDQQEATTGSAGMITGGEATYYEPAMGSCGKTNSGDELVAALPKAVMEAQEGANSNNNPLCGRYVQVVRTKDDEGKPMPPKSVKVKVVDKCMGCDPEDIDLSLAAFLQLGLKSTGRFEVAWKLL